MVYAIVLLLVNCAAWSSFGALFLTLSIACISLVCARDFRVGVGVCFSNRPRHAPLNPKP